MTELEQAPAELLNPVSGELVPAGDMPRVAETLVELREYRNRLSQAIAAFSEAVIAESRRQGTRTLNTPAGKLIVGADTELQWDIEELQKLLDAGLPEHRFAELVQIEVTYKVNASVAKQLEGASEKYAEIVEKARSRVPCRQYVSVR